MSGRGFPPRSGHAPLDRFRKEPVRRDLTETGQDSRFGRELRSGAHGKHTDLLGKGRMFQTEQMMQDRIHIG